MARKPINNNVDTTDPIPQQVADALNQAQLRASAIQLQNTAEQNLVHQLLGQAQAADTFGKISKTVWVSKIAFVKEHKLYRALSGHKFPNKAELRGTWAEFCELLGMSEEKANTDITNLREFGQEALESMQQMGIGYREMRQYRLLPEDEKTALIEVAKSGDRESFIDLAEDIIAKHAKEKEGLTARAIEAEQQLEDKDKVLSDKNQQLDEMATKLARIKKLPPNEVVTQLRKECNAYADEVEELMRHQLRAAFTAISDDALLHPDLESEHRAYLSMRLDLLDDALLFLRGQLGIERTREMTNVPEWADDDSESETITQQ